MEPDSVQYSNKPTLAKKLYVNKAVFFTNKNVKLYLAIMMPICNPKPDLHNVNAHTKFGENPLTFTHYHPEMKIKMCGGHTTLLKIDETCPLEIPNQIPTISMHTPSLVKIHWCLLIIIQKRNMDWCTTDK